MSPQILIRPSLKGLIRDLGDGTNLVLLLLLLLLLLLVSGVACACQGVFYVGTVCVCACGKDLLRAHACSFCHHTMNQSKV
jgi:hypothetical protein